MFVLIEKKVFITTNIRDSEILPKDNDNVTVPLEVKDEAVTTET